MTRKELTMTFTMTSNLKNPLVSMIYAKYFCALRVNSQEKLENIM